jgi:alpha-methylacyl-CoA racemase
MNEITNASPFTQPKWLAGVRILDFTRLLPGPYATQLMADLGAEVIKVEQVGMGDNMRYYPPYFEGDKSKDRLSALFVCVNHGKKSITLDLKNATDQQRFLELCKGADAVVESFRPGVMTRMNIDYDAVKVVKPDIIYISLSGYGQFGPYRDLPGHDMNYVGLMGNLSLNGKK